MTEKERIRISKFLSLMLRHEPERVEWRLGDAGWVGVEELLQAVNRHGVTLTLEQPNGVWLVDQVPSQFIEFPSL
jgi:putative RNA 2'-phosphotransferase